MTSVPNTAEAGVRGDQGQPDGGSEVIDALSVVEAYTRGEVDTQITTARKYPRSNKQFIDDCRTLVTLNEDVAASCTYALPRREDGKLKTIFGPSARFAEAVASCWGNMRAGSFVVGEDERFVTVRGFAWDLQKNIAVAFDIKRRITGMGGKRYSEDMISTTTAAAGSIAYRNAVLKVVPSAIWKPVWQESRQVVAGEIKTLVERRDAAIKSFEQLGVPKERLLRTLGLGGLSDFNLNHIEILRGAFTAIREEGVDIDSLFPADEPVDQRPLADRLKDKVNGSKNEEGGGAPIGDDVKKAVADLERQRQEKVGGQAPQTEPVAAPAETKPATQDPPFEGGTAKPDPKREIARKHLFSKTQPSPEQKS